MVKAAIDLGTVTSRLMIGKAEEGRVDVLQRCITITNLGEGLTTSGKISEAAFLRLRTALLSFREAIAEYANSADSLVAPKSIVPIKAVATSAMRDATNSEDVLMRLKDIGFDIEIISGPREAELSFNGTLSGFSLTDTPVLSIDVGGGSTELILGSKQNGIKKSHSFDMGSRRVTEMFLKKDPPEAKEIAAAKKWIYELSKDFFDSLPSEPSEVIAVAGTATTAITIRDQIAEYDTDLVHGKRLFSHDLTKILSMLSKKEIKERMQVVGLHPGRAPVIIGGLLVLSVLLDLSGRDSLLVSDTDILQGIILDEAKI